MPGTGASDTPSPASARPRARSLPWQSVPGPGSDEGVAAQQADKGVAPCPEAQEAHR